MADSTHLSSMAKAYNQHAGFSIAATPAILGLGLAFTIASVPGFFGILTERVGEARYLGAMAQVLHQASLRWADLASEIDETDFNRWALVVAFYFTAGALACSLLRSLILRSAAPTIMAALGLVGGIAIVPFVVWSIVGVSWAFRIIAIVDRLIGQFLEWLAPALRVLGVALVVVGVVVLIAGMLFLMLAAMTALWRARHLWVVAGLAIAAALAIGMLIESGSLGWIWSLASEFFTQIASILSSLAAFIVGWAIRLLLLLSLVLFVVGALMGTLGTVGRSVYLSIKSARHAGHGPKACADFSASLGGIFSIVLTAAAFNPEFASLLSETWSSLTGLSALPLPLDSFRTVLPGAADPFLASTFHNYSPIVDGTLAAIISFVATASLALSAPPPLENKNARLVVPVMLGVGALIAAAVPIVLLLLMAASASD